MTKEELINVKEILIVVDMVKGFVNCGPMADPSINRITPNIINLIEEFLKESNPVFFIKDSHEKNSVEFNTYPPHCIVGTKESELIDELIPYEKDSMVYLKNSTSTIFAPNFLDDIELMNDIERIIVTGCCTDICIMNLVIPLINYFLQKNQEVELIVPKNAVDTYDSKLHNREKWNDMAFKFMEQAGAKTPKVYTLGGK